VKKNESTIKPNLYLFAKLSQSPCGKNGEEDHFFNGAKSPEVEAVWECLDAALGNSLKSARIQECHFVIGKSLGDEAEIAESETNLSVRSNDLILIDFPAFI